MKRIHRLGYSRYAHPFLSPGWRRLFWRFWWFNQQEERRALALHAQMWGIEAHPLESTGALRKRILKRVKEYLP